jgi:hypothetical protein
MNTLDYQISILEAKKAGKVIQYWDYSKSKWNDTTADKFNFVLFKYRVKPEKVVRYAPVVKIKDGYTFGVCRRTEERAWEVKGALDVVKVEYEPK